MQNTFTFRGSPSCCTVLFLDADTRVVWTVWLRRTVRSTVRTLSGRTGLSETYWLPHGTAESDGLNKARGSSLYSPLQLL